MLILDRHVGESIDLIDRDSGKAIATVKVLAHSRNGNVRLGFDAGPEVTILRDNAINRRDGREQEDSDDKATAIDGTNGD